MEFFCLIKAGLFATVMVIASTGWAFFRLPTGPMPAYEIYLEGSDRLEKMIPCPFGQRSVYIFITYADGVTCELTPVGDAPGNFRDQKGHAVHRQSGLGGGGQIFRFSHESFYVYWDTSA